MVDDNSQEDISEEHSEVVNKCLDIIVLDAKNKGGINLNSRYLYIDDSTGVQIELRPEDPDSNLMCMIYRFGYLPIDGSEKEYEYVGNLIVRID